MFQLGIQKGKETFCKTYFWSFGLPNCHLYYQTKIKDRKSRYKPGLQISNHGNHTAAVVKKRSKKSTSITCQVTMYQ